MNYKLTYLTIITTILMSCGSNEQTDKIISELNQDTSSTIIDEPILEVSSTPCKGIELTKNSDAYTCLDYGDSIIYSYDNYTVKTFPHAESNGNVIEIRYHKYGSKVIIGKENSAFFMGLYGDRAIIDEGTGNIRTLYIYDAIVSEKVIYSDSYLNDLRIEDDLLFFEKQVEAELVNPKPECPEELKEMEDYIGYIGVHVYDFKQKGSYFSGEFKCQYFE